jgi:hypothetical protein
MGGFCPDIGIPASVKIGIIKGWENEIKGPIGKVKVAWT